MTVADHPQNIEIKDLANTVTKTIKCPIQTNEIFYGGTASLLLSAPASVVLFDIQQQKTLAEIATPAVKYVVWSTDGNMVALLSKHSTFQVHAQAQANPCSHHYRQQDSWPECVDPRDYQDQVRCLG